MTNCPDFSALPLPPLNPPPAVTPRHVLHPDLLGERLAVIRDRFSGRRVRFAYSVKTNPDPRMIRSALSLGMDIEAITQAEALLAQSEGATPDRIVLNGPGKWWPRVDRVVCKALFANDVREFSVIESLRSDGVDLEAQTVGVRLTTAAMQSRFGIAAEDDHALSQAARHLKCLVGSVAFNWGVHVHHAQSACGTDAWIERCADALAGVGVLSEAVGTRPSLIDFGGGWRAKDLQAAPAAIAQVVTTDSELLADPNIEWEFEFGKALVEPLGVVYARVLIPPDANGSTIVDAGMGDMFEGMVSPHRTYLWRDEWVRVPVGGATVYGRTCVEHDVLVRDLDTSEFRFGDVLAFGDAGAYDVALSFDFTNGQVRSNWFL